MDTLGFSARRSLEEAINTDCRSQAGRCSGVKTNEPRCAEIVAAAVPTPADDKKGKDKGKEKKK